MSMVHNMMWWYYCCTSLYSPKTYVVLYPKQGFNKGHVEVYRASVDDLLQFHQLKWNSNHFNMFYLNAWKFPGFSYAWMLCTHRFPLYFYPQMLGYYILWDITAQDAFKADFLRELVNLAKDNPHPILIGGDFNLLRFWYEKSKGRFDDHWSFLFNVVIDSLDLREVLIFFQMEA
jgi:hypothetical protein